VAVPDGHAAFVHPRSGLAARHGITVVNAPGTVDAGYRGEVRVVLLNTDPAEPFTVRRGDRIAQLVVQPVTRVSFLDAGRAPRLPAGEGGFGSTGAKVVAGLVAGKARSTMNDRNDQDRGGSGWPPRSAAADEPSLRRLLTDAVGSVKGRSARSARRVRPLLDDGAGPGRPATLQELRARYPGPGDDEVARRLIDRAPRPPPAGHAGRRG
jgi:hypothetical protein